MKKINRCILAYRVKGVKQRSERAHVRYQDCCFLKKVAIKLDFCRLMHEHTFAGRSLASSAAVGDLLRARAAPGGFGPGANLFPTRWRRRSGPRRWCAGWRESERPSSRSGPERPSSRSTGCGGFTAAVAPGSWQQPNAQQGGMRREGVG